MAPDAPEREPEMQDTPPCLTSRQKGPEDDPLGPLSLEQKKKSNRFASLGKTDCFLITI